jgi:fibronectin-binding autotransporter adhesin
MKRSTIVRGYVLTGLLLTVTALPAQTDRFVASVGGNDSGNNCADQSAPCATIQYAVDQSQPHDVIHVAPLAIDYLEQISVTKSLTIRSSVPGELPVIKASTIPGTATNRVVTVSGEGVHVVLEHLEIRHGRATIGGGIFAAIGASITVIDSVITTNQATATGGGGIAGSGPMQIFRTRVENNQAPAGGGIWVNSIASLQVVDSYIAQNTAAHAGGGIFNLGEFNAADDEIGVIITGNEAGAVGGGIYNGGAASLTRVGLSGNALSAANGKGGGIFNEGSLSMLQGGMLENIAPGGSGGGLYNDNGYISMIDCVVISNQSGYGAGIYNSNDGSEIHFSELLVAQNIVTDGHGGGIFNAGLMAGSDSIVAHNVVEMASFGGNGGGIYNGGLLDLSEVIIGANTADGTHVIDPNGNITLLGQGGGIYNEFLAYVADESLVFNNNARGAGGISNHGYFELDHSQVGGNTASIFEGGGVNNLGELHITDSSIVLNSSAQSGGGIFNWGHLTLAGSNIGHNTAQAGGGIFNMLNGTAIIGQQTLIEQNQATFGGGIYNRNSLTISENSEIVANAATTNGGGIYHQGGETLIQQATVQDNVADGNGGGLHVQFGTVIVDLSSLDSNSANLGGAIHNAATLVVKSSAISSNSANDGGGINNIGSAVLVVSTLNQNTGGVGGGIRNAGTGSQLEIVASALFANTASLAGSALRIVDGEVEVRHSMIAGNTGSGAASVVGGNATLTRNWWGAENGPGGAGPGNGDSISISGGSTAFNPWLAVLDLQTTEAMPEVLTPVEVTAILMDNTGTNSGDPNLAVRIDRTGVNTGSTTLPFTGPLLEVIHSWNSLNPGQDNVLAEVLFAGELSGLIGTIEINWTGDPAPDLIFTDRFHIQAQ